MITEMVE